MTDEKMHNYGYYEVYIPVWNPETQDRPVNMTVDIYGDEETLKEISPWLEECVVNYGNPDYDMSECEESFIHYLRSLIRNDLIMDVYCDEFDISSVEDLEKRLQEDSFSTFPL